MFRPWLVSLLLLLCPAAYSHALEPDTIQQIQSLLDHRKFQQALDMADSIPDSPDTTDRKYTFRASALAALGKDKDALESANKAISANPKFTPAFAARGLAQMHLHDYQKSLDDCNRAVVLDPTFARGYTCRVYPLCALDQAKSALADAQKAIELDSKKVHGYYARARAYTVLTEYQSAINDLTTVIKMDDQYSLAYAARAHNYVLLHQYGQAEGDLETALHIDPKSSLAYELKGAVDLQTFRLQDAISDFTQAIQLDPKNRSLYAERAGAYTTLASSEALTPTMYEAIGASPSDGQSSADQYYRKAVQDYDSAIEIEPAYGLTYSGRSGVYVALGQLDKALSDINQALRLPGPKTPSVAVRNRAIEYKHRGLIFYQQHKYSNAIADFTQSIAIQPDASNPYLWRSRAYDALNQNDLSSKDYDKYTQLLKIETAAADSHK